MAAQAISQQQDGGKGNPTPPATNTVAKIAVIGKLAEAAAIFDDAQAAEYIGGIKARAVRDWRTRRGLPYIRITAKVCRIRRADLDRWLAQHRVATMKGPV
jgi:hypothetical protein